MTHCHHCHDVGSFTSAHSGLVLRCPHCAGRRAVEREEGAALLVVMAAGSLFIIGCVALAALLG
jgi:hypothetical protein